MANTRKVGSPKVGIQTTTKPEFNYRLFERATVGELKSAQSIADDCSLEIESAAYEEALELFNIHNEGIELGDKFSSAVEAVQAIAEWLAETNYVYTPPKKYDVTSFTVTVTVPTGTPNSTVAFSVNGIVGENFTFEEAIFAAQEELSAMLQKKFKKVAEEKKQPTAETTVRETDTQIEFATIRAQKYNGKLVHRLVPIEGSWTQHGVPLYGDVANKAGIDLSDYSKEGDYELSGTMDIQYKPDGKPMRAHNVELE